MSPEIAANAEQPIVSPSDVSSLSSPARSGQIGEANPFYPAELVQIANAIKGGETPSPTTVRRLLSWFGGQRRGYLTIYSIKHALESLGIQTIPDFSYVWIDSEISFVSATNKSSDGRLGGDASDIASVTGQTVPDEATKVLVDLAQTPAEVILVGGAIEDPTYRIGKLAAANQPVISVAPNQPLQQAVTLMLQNNFSQIPVMQGERDVKGILTWESIGARLALGKTNSEVRDFMSSAQVISADKSLFAAIEVIVQHQYVLVQAADRRISGIVTSADLSRQFQQLTEPFLLLGEIEQHIRKLIVNKFTVAEVRMSCDPTDVERQIDDVADLTMGEYIRLLENTSYWDRIDLHIDRGLFIEQLQTVRRIRNDIMHFDPDPLGSKDLDSLRRFVVFMQSLRELGAF